MLNDWTNVAHGQWAKVGTHRFRQLIDKFERVRKTTESSASNSSVVIEPTENGLTPKQHAIENLKAIGALRYSRDMLALVDKYLPPPPSPIYDRVESDSLPLPPPPTETYDRPLPTSYSDRPLPISYSDRPLPTPPSENSNRPLPTPPSKSPDVSRPLPIPPTVDFSELDRAIEDLSETIKPPTLSIANSIKPRQDDDDEEDDW